MRQNSAAQKHHKDTTADKEVDIGTPWSVQLDDQENPAFTNCLFSQGIYGTNLTAGQVTLCNFTALLATNHITGHLQDNNSVPLANIQVFAYAGTGGKAYQAQADTDSSGNYSLNVANGNWTVCVCSGCPDC